MKFLGALVRVVGRSLHPVDRWRARGQTVVLILALALGGGAIGLKWGPWEGAFGAIGFLSLLVLSTATRMQQELDADARLVFGEPVVKNRLIAPVSPPQWGKFASVPIANKPARPNESARVREIRANVAF